MVTSERKATRQHKQKRSNYEYRWWARKYSKQRILLRLLQLELLSASLHPDDRREIEEMIRGLREQIARRKRDMEKGEVQ